MESLRQEHKEVVTAYLDEVSRKQSNRYMLTISRDGEMPERSILFFDNPIDAVEGYNKYQDHGFAKNFLTVILYDPSGGKQVKILKRNLAGDPTFVRQNYYDTINLLKSIKNKISEEAYIELINGFAKIFNEDNWRFNPDRFLTDLNVKEVI
jgi:hypothetical protein